MPPDAYRPEVIAQALVEVAIRPRAEVVLGGETVIMDLLDTYARPVSQRVLMTIDRWYRSGDQPSPDPGALWRPPNRARLGGGIPGRDSLLAPLQLGRRLLPHPLTPVRIGRHLARAGGGRRSSGPRSRSRSPSAASRPAPRRSRGAPTPPWSAYDPRVAGMTDKTMSRATLALWRRGQHGWPASFPLVQLPARRCSPRWPGGWWRR